MLLSPESASNTMYDPSAGRDPRDSVFLLAEIEAADESGGGTFRVRNISRGGLMADGPLLFQPGTAVVIQLRNLGSVAGQVAWTDRARIGVCFDHPIDPRAVRQPVVRRK